VVSPTWYQTVVTAAQLAGLPTPPLEKRRWFGPVFVLTVLGCQVSATDPLRTRPSPTARPSADSPNLQRRHFPSFYFNPSRLQAHLDDR